MDESVAVVAGAVLNATFLTPTELARQGLRRHAIARLVAAGRLIRLANGRLVGTDCPAQLVAAGRHRARLDCVSLLALLGVFTGDRRGPMHVQIEAGSSRLPPATSPWWRTGDGRSRIETPSLHPSSTHSLKRAGVRHRRSRSRRSTAHGIKGS